VKSVTKHSDFCKVNNKICTQMLSS
jgi:hypothetical protein